MEIWKKEKVDCSKRPSEKEKEKKMVVNKSKRKKNDEKEKKNKSAIWALLCKVSGIDDIWKEKIVLH